MKLFTKLALVSAVAISSNAMAMQAMDDAALSSTTGQDGISIGIGISKVDIEKVHIFDGDGLAAAGVAGDAGFGGTGQVGAITLNNVVVTGNTPTTNGQFAELKIDTDSGTGGKAFLNVAAEVAGLDIDLGKIEVNTASGTSGAYVAGTGGAEILSGLTLKTGVTTANIQLGNTPQGAMIKLGGSMVGGLEINDLAIKDASTGGGGYIVLGGIKLSDNGNTNGDLSLDADVAVTKNGLAITAMKNATGTDIYITKVVLGGGDGFTPKSGATAAIPGTGVGSGSIGDIAISGMKVFHGTAPGAVITISGH